MTAPSLKPCTYRKAQAGYLVCTIAEVDGGDSSKYVNAQVCSECPIPEKATHANCQHFQAGTRVHHIHHSGGTGYYLSEVRQECTVLSFASAEEMDAICGPTCPQNFPVHRDLSDETILEITALPAEPTERDIRQAVLLALHEYNGRHTERYAYFDVTPDFLARSLQLHLTAIYRVLGPMAEADEVKVLQGTREIHPQYVTLTAKGIEAITTEPLFENKGVRVSNDNRIQVEHLNAGQVQLATGKGQNTATVNQGTSAQQLLELLSHMKQQVAESPVPAEVKAETSELIDIVFEELQAPTPRPARVNTTMKHLKEVLEKNPATTALVGGLIQAGTVWFAAHPETLQAFHLWASSPK